MPQVFPKKLDFFTRLSGAGLILAALTGVAFAYYYLSPEVQETGYMPVQPVPYSHKLHAGNLGMDCYYCHTTVEKSAHAAIPPTETCMNCHTKVKEKSALLAPIRESYETGKAVPWVNVHVLPDYVFFNHQSHVTVGVSCVSCHGRIDQMVEVKQVKPLNMAWCLECHRNPAPNLRPVQFVTKLDWQPEGDPAEYGRQVIAAKGINPPQNCSGCHR